MKYYCLNCGAENETAIGCSACGITFTTSTLECVCHKPECVCPKYEAIKAELEAAKKELQEYYDLTDVKNKMIELMANEIDPRVLYFDSDHAVEVTETVDGIIERFRAEAEKEE